MIVGSVLATTFGSIELAFSIAALIAMVASQAPMCRMFTGSFSAFSAPAFSRCWIGVAVGPPKSAALPM